MRAPTTQRQLLLGVVLVCLLAMPLAGVGIGAVAADGDTDTERTADLVIEQPHYIDGDVRETSENGHTVYEAEGAELRLYPQQFDHDDVIATSIDPDSASLSEAPGDGYLLVPEETGTHDIYWTVEEQRADGNETTTVTVDYEATIRVGGDLDTVVVSQEAYQETQELASEREDTLATAESYIDSSPVASALGIEPAAFIDEGLDMNFWKYHPVAIFTGGLVMFVISLFTFGGLLVLATGVAYHTKAMIWAQKRLGIHEATESVEGEMAEKLEDDKIRQQEKSLNNKRFEKLFMPHAADGMKAVGETPNEAWSNVSANALHPDVMAVFKAKAMALAGYRARIRPGDGLAADGGVVPDEWTLEDRIALARQEDSSVELVEPRADIDDEETAIWLPLDAAEREWADVLPVNDPRFIEFDATEADIDIEAIDIETVDWDLRELLQELQVDLRYYENERVAAAYMYQFIELVREHPITDSDGRIDGCRMTLETFLRDCELLGDRHDIPVAQLQKDLLEAAIAADDPVGDALETVADDEQGKYA